MRLTVVVDNAAVPPLVGEHGLSLFLEYGGGGFLFDTGAGGALAPNLSRLGIEPRRVGRVILSHGHYDHTGGLASLPEVEIYCCPGVEVRRFSRHPGMPVRDISMPPVGVAALRNRREITGFSRIFPGMFLTGPIPRVSGEDCGGPFFLDHAGKTPDPIADEQALLLGNGVLIQGCCHAGIINTLEYCRRMMPQLPVRTVVGGLHLLHASVDRLKLTAEYLNSSSIERLILLHCTGESAAAYLTSALSACEVSTAGAGSAFEFSE